MLQLCINALIWNYSFNLFELAVCFYVFMLKVQLVQLLLTFSNRLNGSPVEFDQISDPVILGCDGYCRNKPIGVVTEQTAFKQIETCVNRTQDIYDHSSDELLTNQTIPLTLDIIQSQFYVESLINNTLCTDEIYTAIENGIQKLLYRSCIATCNGVQVHASQSSVAKCFENVTSLLTIDEINRSFNLRGICNFKTTNQVKQAIVSLNQNRHSNH
ncbi:hypothetical protein BC833DRAFT_189143 [Globomyces pollinis-pini]|nr:hypothetical protein BC833DRAFT_189143 [Globomyces pollinis-pini]